MGLFHRHFDFATKTKIFDAVPCHTQVYNTRWSSHTFKNNSHIHAFAHTAVNLVHTRVGYC